jgi:hypothetical protein
MYSHPYDSDYIHGPALPVVDYDVYLATVEIGPCVIHGVRALAGPIA